MLAFREKIKRNYDIVITPNTKTIQGKMNNCMAYNPYPWMPFYINLLSFRRYCYYKQGYGS